MNFSLAKRLGLWVVARGIRLPEGPANRYQELTQLTRLLSKLGINCVLDVGANVGQFASELRGAGYAGRIESFEPVPQAFSKLGRAFAGDSGWRGHQLALGREDASMTMNVLTEFTEMSSMLMPRESRSDLEPESVAVRRLDGIFDQLVADLADPRVFLKLDTQGFDLEAFAGASGCLDRILGLQSELSVVPYYDGSPGYLESLAVFTDAGFELTNLSVVSRSADGRLLEANCLMRRAETRSY